MFTAKIELDRGYSTLMFFKARECDGLVYRGPQDLDGLMAFVYNQVGILRRGMTVMIQLVQLIQMAPRFAMVWMISHMKHFRNTLYSML